MISFNTSTNHWEDNIAGSTWLALPHMDSTRVYECSPDFLKDYIGCNTKSKYIFRNLPNDCINNDPYGIRWCIVGTYPEYGSGVLEWCTSFEDAYILKHKMTTYNSDYKYGGPIKIDISCENIISCYMSGRDEKILIRFSKGDKVAVYFEHSHCYHVGTVKEINYGTSFYALIAIDREYSVHMNEYYPAVTNTTTDNLVFFDSRFLIKVVKYCNIITQPYNSLRDLIIDPPENYIDAIYNQISIELAKLPYFIRNTDLVENMVERFFKLYPPSQREKINKKLIKSWVKCNYSRLLTSQREFDLQYLHESWDDPFMDSFDDSIDSSYDE